MWDGNTRTKGRVQSVTDSLSENQCGMETCAASGSPLCTGLSENQCGMETTLGMICSSLNSGLSENQCGMETYGAQSATYRKFCVEREPMWDGNIWG